MGRLRRSRRRQDIPKGCCAGIPFLHTGRRSPFRLRPRKSGRLGMVFQRSRLRLPRNNGRKTCKAFFLYSVFCRFFVFFCILGFFRIFLLRLRRFLKGELPLARAGLRQCQLDGMVHQIENIVLVGEAHLGFGRVNIDIHKVGRHLKKQDPSRELALHRSAFERHLHARHHGAVADVAAVDVEILHTPAGAAALGLGKAGGPKHVRLVALSGPTHAEEVAIDLPTTIVSASPDAEAAKFVQEVFSNTCMRVYTNEDIKGVELSGAMKNVIALGVGISTGLGYGDNARAALITRGIAEIARLGVAMGCNVHTFAGLAGIGDLIVTATSMHSRNNRAGILIGKGETPETAVKEVGMVVEGMNALPAALELADRYQVEMPIVQTVNAIVNKGMSAADAVRALMDRDPKNELPHGYEKPSQSR